MMNRLNRWMLWVCVAGVSACSSAEGDSGTEDGSTSEAETTGSATTSSTTGMSGTASMTGASASTTTTTGVMTSTTGPVSTGDSSDTGNDDNGFINPETGDPSDTAVDPQPLGGQCASAEECESGFCYLVPQIGGLCSECLVDQDCDGGTCSISIGMGFAECAPGNQGDGCNTDEGCIGELVCGELIDTGGIINASFCSECKISDDCDEGELCVPEYSAGELGGSLSCATENTVPNDSGCNLTEPTACASGFCGEADLFGFFQIGVCGECIVDEDCPDEGQTCMAGSVGMAGLSGATCI